jgi:ParB-like chromosome segregation protein Spo0J
MIKEINIKEIKSNPNNPRVLKDDKFKKLVQSLKDFPEMANVRPIVVNTDMIVLGGNMRLRAMQEAGWKKAPVQIVDWSIEKQNEFIIKDNVGFGEWDWDILANEWNESELTDWGLDIPIFKDSEDELKDLSSEIDNLYRIEIVCKDEEHQENTYNKLIEQGYECRLLTL